MAWKYQVRRDGQRISKDPHFYVPFQIREETFVSPYYHFKPRQVSLHAQSTKNNKQNNSLGALPIRKPLPTKSLHSSLSYDSDDEEYLLSDELRAMKLRIQKQGRRKAIVMPNSFGLQVEDLFNGQLSSLAKFVNEDQRNPGKTQFEFTKVRSGLLDEMEQVKEMIGRHKEVQEAVRMQGLEKETKNEDTNNEITQTEQEDTQTMHAKIRIINTDNNKSLNSEENLQQYHQKQRLFARYKQKNQLEIQGYAPSERTKQQNEQTQEEYGQPNDEKAQDSGSCSLREIFVLIKKSKKAHRFAVNVEKTIIPYYNYLSHPNNHGDTSSLQYQLDNEFQSWRDSLAKILVPQGTNHAPPKVFTCGGIQITNLQQVSPSENILIFQCNKYNIASRACFLCLNKIFCYEEDDDQLEFWHEFQAGNGIQLSAAAQKSFIDSLSNMKTKDQMLKAFMSPSFISKVSLRQVEQQAYQVQKMDKSLNISGIAASRRVSASSLVLPNILAASPAKGQAASGSSTSNNSKHAKQELTVNTKHSRKQVSLPNLKQDRLKLVDLFSQYQSVLINNIGKKVINPSNAQSIAQGPLMKQFNGLKMKIIQQSFPYLAQKFDGSLNKSMKNQEITYQDILNSVTTKTPTQASNPTK